MTFPAGRYAVLEGVEISHEHILEVSTPFIVVHSRAVTLRDGGIKGALACLLVGEDAEVVTYRNGKKNEIYPLKKE